MHSQEIPIGRHQGRMYFLALVDTQNQSIREMITENTKKMVSIAPLPETQAKNRGRSISI